MAVVNSINRKKLEQERKARANKLKEQVKKFKEQPSQRFDSEIEKKDDVINLYQSMSPTQKALFDKELENKKIRENYALYLRKVYQDYIFTPFHALLCNIVQSVVEKVENGQKVRLCLACPPQHGKSKTVTETAPSWFIGRNPNKRAILTAYNADIAEKFGDKNRQLMKNYGEELFGLKISDSQDNKTLWDIDKKSGGLYSAGILGGITSNTSQFTIVDDPYKNGQEAENPEIREKVWQTFVDSVLTRSNGQGNAVIVIHTRWHDDDLIGRLIKLGWAYINIPCVWEKGVDKLLNRKIGQTLCPELGFDSQWATQMQQALGQRKWNALYQGKPFIDGGNIIKREDIRYYNAKSKPASFEELVLSCDLSFGGTKKSNDPYCMTLWGRNGGNHYLLKIYDKRASFVETNNTIRIICQEYPQLRKKLIEKKANGQATIDLLGQEIGGFVEFDPKEKSKETRLNLVTPYFEGGNVFFPEESLEPNIENYIEQLLRFPNVVHEDFVDTISQYLLNYEYRNGGKIPTDGYYTDIANAFRGIKI